MVATTTFDLQACPASPCAFLSDQYSAITGTIHGALAEGAGRLDACP